MPCGLVAQFVARFGDGQVLQAISAAQSDAGQFSDAHRTASEIEPQDVHVDALKHLAIAESRRGLRDEAERHLAEAIQIALEGIKES
jgi:Flp pilus assembly protein TadD